MRPPQFRSKRFTLGEHRSCSGRARFSALARGFCIVLMHTIPPFPSYAHPHIGTRSSQFMVQDYDYDIPSAYILVIPTITLFYPLWLLNFSLRGLGRSCTRKYNVCLCIFYHYRSCPLYSTYGLCELSGIVYLSFCYLGMAAFIVSERPSLSSGSEQLRSSPAHRKPCPNPPPSRTNPSLSPHLHPRNPV